MSGKSLTRPVTSGELFPIAAEPDVTRMIFRRARRDRYPDGKMIIDEPISSIDREIIARRMRDLTPGLAPARRGDIAQQVTALFAGFRESRFADDDEAQATVAQYVRTLEGLPFFAIARACLRFARAEVKPEEVRAKTLAVDRAPDCTHLRIVAEKIARPHWDELSVGSMLLSARFQPRAAPETAEQRAEKAVAIKRANEEFQCAMANKELDRIAEENRARERSADDLKNRQRDALIDDYRRRGLEPVYADEGKTVVVSLPMMLHQGWRIEETRFGGEVQNKLVKREEVP